jgi:hypothetical protein
MVRYARLGLVAALALFGAGACSAGQPKAAAPTVATLTNPSTVASRPASPSPERPRRRLDDTAADTAALEKPFDKCMGAHGQTIVKGFDQNTDLPKATKAAQDACLKFWPLPPWEEDPANPEARDFARDVVKCLKNKGVRYVDTGSNGIDISAGGPQSDSDSIAKTGKYLDECQRDVAAHKS